MDAGCFSRSSGRFSIVSAGMSRNPRQQDRDIASNPYGQDYRTRNVLTR